MDKKLCYYSLVLKYILIESYNMYIPLSSSIELAYKYNFLKVSEM